MIYIGIDPGVNTGVAVWNSETKNFYCIESMTILDAMYIVNDQHIGCKINVIIEDARQRKWFGNSGKEVLQGAGSIKRDCQIWQEFLEANEITHYWVAPKDNRTKLSSAQFKAYTGYTGKTNEHGRDAAMLVFKR
jgi:hypothetical protein